MNKVIVIGRLTKDPEIRYGTSGSAFGRYTLAVDRRFKKDGEQSADYISCKVFGKAAEIAEKYLHKGTKIAIEGRIQTDSYTNKDGSKVYTTDIVVDSQEFCEKKSEGQPEHTGGFAAIPDGLDEEVPFV